MAVIVLPLFEQRVEPFGGDVVGVRERLVPRELPEEDEVIDGFNDRGGSFLGENPVVPCRGGSFSGENPVFPCRGGSFSVENPVFPVWRRLKIAVFMYKSPYFGESVTKKPTFNCYIFLDGKTAKLGSKRGFYRDLMCNI